MGIFRLALGIAAATTAAVVYSKKRNTTPTGQSGRDGLSGSAYRTGEGGTPGTDRSSEVGGGAGAGVGAGMGGGSLSGTDLHSPSGRAGNDVDDLLSTTSSGSGLSGGASGSTDRSGI